MRRRLALLSLATTALVVISLLIPLGLLVRRQAGDRARLEAERTAQSTAALLALTVSLNEDAGAIESALGPLDPGTVVVLPDGTVLGEPMTGQGTLVPIAVERQATISGVVEGGWEYALPVIGLAGTAVVDVFVTDEALSDGVVEAWLLLALLGVLLVAIAVWVADRLGERLVRPISDLASAARQLGAGDLDARVEVSDPEEIREVGESFNWLAGRLEELIAEEREAAADLSHRLRTPLTSLRLQAEKVTDDGEREEVLGQVGRLEQAIDQLIVATRSATPGQGGVSDLSSVVSARCSFWAVLAEEQRRVMTLNVDDHGPVALSREAVEAVVDALVGNVFSHTDPATPFDVTVGSEGGRPWLEVSDHGPGFASRTLAVRGVSGAGSTGLGLDIVRRTAESAGGGMEMFDRPGGGAVVRVWLGPSG
ncbi:MAG: integral rane sensor signal transduction histidine kinase [Acidimicrobiia bacterium]|nr:integral rane sensor signal transduction histidine kinase [Acidimicrobiia bacterium]